MNGIVPFTMKGLGNKVYIGHLLVGYSPPFAIAPFIEAALYPQPRLRLRCTNQLYDHLMRHQRLTPPVLGDKREEPVLDFVPLTRSRRAHLDGHLQLVRQLLQLHFP